MSWSWSCAHCNFYTVLILLIGDDLPYLIQPADSESYYLQFYMSSTYNFNQGLVSLIFDQCYDSFLVKTCKLQIQTVTIFEKYFPELSYNLKKRTSLNSSWPNNISTP